MRSIAVALVLMSGASPAWAGSDECRLIEAAYLRLAEVPAYQQIIDQEGADPMESIAIGETLYVKISGTWSKMSLKAGGRQQIMKQLFDSASVTDCRSAAAEDIDGIAATVYDYTLPPIEGLSGKPSQQRVWIGQDDGLPHRMDTEGMKITIKVGDMTAPIP
ncbi:MAG: hypothetical protein KF914_14830 [Rhizobiaceae bacterium]|nr:hypothetical protein [Rhizobiaceae bacterium]